MNKKRIYSLDCMRVVAFICIIVYHFFVHLQINGSFYLTDQFVVGGNSNMHVATLAVGVFFILSGFGLMLSANKSFDLKRYYLGRVTKILIPFWVTYACYFVYKCIIAGGWPFVNVGRKTFVFTILGMDEWVSMLGIPTMSLGIGEWFLGNLMVLYLVFPLLRWCLLKFPWITRLAVLALYCFIAFNYHYNVVVHMNPFLKGCEFFIGMCLAMDYEKINKHVGWAGLAALLLFRFCPVELPIPQALKITLLATLVFVMFLCLNGVFEKHEKVNRLFKTVSAYSYEIFLVHHIFILINADRVMGVSQNAGQVALIALIDAAEIVAAAVLLHFVTSRNAGNLLLKTRNHPN
mgnify:FL=1